MSDTKASGPSLTEAVETLRQRSARLRKVINRTPEDIALADSMDAVLKALADVTQEERDGSRLIQRQSDLLTGVVNALKGEPPSLTLWSHHDAPELARQAVAALAQREQAIQTLREWMAQYPDDKYTGRWWAGELDRLLRVAPPRPEEDRK
jgi:hypothetical protein